jgi:hypothetical protein
LAGFADIRDHLRRTGHAARHNLSTSR